MMRRIVLSLLAALALTSSPGVALADPQGKYDANDSQGMDIAKMIFNHDAYSFYGRVKMHDSWTVSDFDAFDGAAVSITFQNSNTQSADYFGSIQEFNDELRMDIVSFDTGESIGLGTVRQVSDTALRWSVRRSLIGARSWSHVSWRVNCFDDTDNDNPYEDETRGWTHYL